MSENIKVVDRVTFIKEQCQGKKVLHLGCTNYPYTSESLKNNDLLHFRLAEISGELYGFDFDQKGLDILSENGTKNLYLADLEKLDEVDLNETFDVIVAGEMIEHLSNVGLFLRGIKRFMHTETKLIITTINAYGALRFAIYALRGNGGIKEFVHPDHVAYYSYSTLRLVISRENLEVKDFYFYNIGPEHLAHLPIHYRICNRLFTKFSQQLNDGIIAVCKIG
jgi:2-polyprenyl-3-methyl-5-hydroxy-6-metoxy-1,4-benzoquinol methylase